MTKKEFLELADKYEQGTCSKNEEALLYKFCDEVQFKNLIADWDLSQESAARINLLKRILQTIKAENNKKSITKFKKWVAVAAILIGFVTISYFYVQRNSNGFKNEISKNAITLELEDGTIKAIKENDTNTFFNKKGNIVGKQHGNRLVYKTNHKKDDLNQQLVYNTLTVPYGKRFVLELSDGTIVNLNSGTSIKYPVKFIEKLDRQIFVSGEVFLNVAKDALHPFIVNANGLNVKVLGTKFNVNAYPENATSEVVLVEGSVALYQDLQTNGNKTILKPGDKAIFDKSNYTISKKTVIAGIYTSWINGELVFRNMPFENIIKKLERHYNVKIINKTKKMNKTIFNASFGNESIEVILKSLKDNYGLNYSINDKTIIIN